MSTRYLDYAGLVTLVTQLKSYVDSASGSGLTETDVATIVEAYNYLTATDVEAYGYLTSDDVAALVEAYNYLTASDVEAYGYQTADDVSDAISSAISAAYEVKGSCAFASLPELADAEIGDVWNITDAFTTTTDFVEGEGAEYPAGTNVVRVEYDSTAAWDVLTGLVDLSGYVEATDLVSITDDEITACFA